MLTFTPLWPLTGARTSLPSLTRKATLEPSKRFNLALKAIGIETLPLESMREIKLDEALVN